MPVERRQKARRQDDEVTQMIAKTVRRAVKDMRRQQDADRAAQRRDRAAQAKDRAVMARHLDTCEQQNVQVLKTLGEHGKLLEPIKNSMGFVRVVGWLMGLSFPLVAVIQIVEFFRG